MGEARLPGNSKNYGKRRKEGTLKAKPTHFLSRERGNPQRKQFMQKTSRKTVHEKYASNKMILNSVTLTKYYIGVIFFGYILV
jgi:hypothetical protein